jgi:hypothetical protein
MRPDVEAVERGEAVPIMAQVYLDEDPETGGPFIHVASVSVIAFADEGATSHPEAGSAS